MRKRRKKKFSVVKIHKEMSRERVPTPRPQVIPDKRSRHAEDLARSIAHRYGEDL